MEIISLTPGNFQNAVNAAANTILQGGTVIIPTDTVYGLAANAFNETAVRKIYQVKKRNGSKPLPIFVKNIGMAKKIARVSTANQKLLEEYWPGKVTAVFLKKVANNQTNIYGTDAKTIALRIPFHPFVNSLMEILNLPITGTSANLSGQAASTKIDDVLSQFKNTEIKPDLAINAGDIGPSQPSKIVDMSGKIIKIIRE